MSSRPIALGFIAVLLSAIAVSAARAAHAPPRQPAPPPRPHTHGYRTFGVGQIRYQGHGPEWWASETRRLGRAYSGEQSRNDRLERRLDRMRRLLSARTTESAASASPMASLVSSFLCIHEREGSWTDPNAPYWGGLQMDEDFMETYGGTLYKTKGHADNWTPAEQIAVAIIAHGTRGFGPWPNTARACGLL
jgi:hypothetical protein